MSQENKVIYQAQSLFLQWLSCFGFRRYELIRSACENLNKMYGYETKNAIYDIFYPLLYSGVVEYAGNSCYTVSSPLLISGKDNQCIVVTMDEANNNLLKDTSIPGIYYYHQAGQLHAELKSVSSVYRFNLMDILKKMPCINLVIESFENSPYHTSEQALRKGARLIKSENAFSYYLINFTQLKKYDIPERVENPDAINLARYYERICNNTPNGYYNSSNKQLSLHASGTPFLLYRVLFINTLLNLQHVKKENDMYIFSSISYNAYKELNRILCNSIQVIYE